MLHRVLTIDFHTLVVSTMDRTTKPLVWRNHRSRNPSKSGGVDQYVPGVGQQYMFLGFSRFLGLGRCPCLLNIHCTLHGNQLRRGQGEIWVLGKYTGPCCIHWIALILLSVSFYFCHLAFCLPVGSTYWAAGRLVGAMGRCNFVAGQSTPRSSQGHWFSPSHPQSIAVKDTLENNLQF